MVEGVQQGPVLVGTFFGMFPSNLPLCLLLVDSHVVQLNLHLPPIRFQVVLDVSTQC